MTTNPTPADVERLIAEAEATLEGVTTFADGNAWPSTVALIIGLRDNSVALIAALRAMQAEKDDMALIAHKANEHLASVKAARDAAEAAAQADYESRIMAALEPAPADEVRRAALIEAADLCAGIRQRIANGPMPEGARFDYEQSILALIEKETK